jgi:hypothetical protein
LKQDPTADSALRVAGVWSQTSSISPFQFVAGKLVESEGIKTLDPGIMSGVMINHLPRASVAEHPH